MSNATLADKFVYTINNVDTVAHVTLNDSGITVCDGKGLHSYRVKHIHLSDIIGVKVHGSAKDSVYLVIHYFPLVKNRFNGKVQRCRKQAVLSAFQHHTAAGNIKQCMQWKRSISLIIHGLENPDDANSKPKKRIFLAFVNPKGGKGMAKKIWLNTVKPVLDLAGIVSEVVYTEYSGHASDYVKNSCDLYKYSSILTVSGDGIIFEVINGLMKREDFADAIRIPLAIIPGGSGNGLCAAILHQSGVPVTLMDAVFIAVRGISTPMDLVKVEQRETIMWSFLSICWGFLSAMDIESEKMRWMGEARFTVQAIKQMLNYPIKSGKLWFVPLDEQDSIQEKPQLAPKSAPLKRQISKDPVRVTQPTVFSETLNEEDENDEEEDGDDLDPSFDFTSLNDTDMEDSLDLDQKVLISDRTRILSDTIQLHESDDCKCIKCHPLPIIDSESLNKITESVESIGLSDEIPDSWTLIEGDFATVMSFSSTHLTLGYQATHDLHLDSGFVYLMHSRRPTIKDFLQLMAQTCKPESNDSSTIHFEKVRAFRLEPEVSESGAYVTIDGELVPYEALHACIYKGLSRVLCLPAAKD